MAGLSQLQTELTAIGRGYQRRGRILGTVGLLGCGLWLSLLFVLLDLLWQLPPVVCWVAWGLLLLGSLGVGVWLWRWLARPLTLEQLCLLVEGQRPELRNRLINAMQFAHSGEQGAADFAQRLLAEQPVEMKWVNAARLFPARTWKLTWWLALAAVLLSVGLAVVAPRGYSTSLQRLLLPMAGVPPYSLTQIVSVTPGDGALLRGQPLAVALRVAGAAPADATLHLRGADGEERRFALTQDTQAGTFSGKSPALFADHAWWVSAGDARSRRFTVLVHSPPALAKWQCQITPPSYTGAAPSEVSDSAGKAEAPEGSALRFSGQSTVPLRAAKVLQDGAVVAEVAVRDTENFSLEVTLPSASPAMLELLASSEIRAEQALPIALLPDMAPAVEFTLAERRLSSALDAVVALPYQAQDDYGIAAVALERVDAKDGPVELTRLTNEDRVSPQLQGRFFLEIATLGLKPGSKVMLRLAARDGGPLAERRIGYSRTLEIAVPMPEEALASREAARREQEKTLAALLGLQQENLKQGREWRQGLNAKQLVPVPAREEMAARQLKVRELAISLLSQPDLLGDQTVALQGLAENEMVAAIAALRDLLKAADDGQPAPLDQALALEQKILATLTGMPQALAFEAGYQDKANLLELLQNLVKRQHQNLTQTKQAATDKLTGEAVVGLVDEQDLLGDLSALFLEQAGRLAKAESEDDFAVQVAKVVTLLQGEQLYEKMLVAAEQVQKEEWPAAIASQETCFKLLLQSLDILNQWRVQQVKDKVAEATKTLAEIADKLGEMEDRQKEISEITKDLAKRGKLDEQVRDELGKLDDEQKEWLALLEKMAQDLYQFPEMPVSGELNGKMREVFEDVEQAANSENTPSMEVAVQKEDALLEAIKNTKDRIEDVEMWLPDMPDQIQWNLESFDAAEFPTMPLVPLPEELEDIVGDLTEQSEQAEQEAQDSTGNQMIADAEMGWDIMDGPMPTFSAKGKSGNMKPNDNEMTGRSGAGREGQATGELAENKVKGLEGRETHARKTNDAFQKGQVEEEEDSTLDAKATGGGKLGGESEHDGMFGDAPRRDAHMQPGKEMRELRQEAEALYATARMLYLPQTRALGAAVENLRRVERLDKNNEGFESLSQRVVKQLRESHTEMAAGAVLPINLQTSGDTGGASAGRDVNLKDVGEEFRGIVADYYKSLNNE